MLSSQLLRQLICQLIEQELAPGELEVLLVHTVAALEASHDHGRRSLKQPEVRIQLHRQLSAHFGAAIVTQRRQLVGLGALVQQNPVRGGHALDERALLTHVHSRDEVVSSARQWLEHLWWRHSNVLRLVVLSCALTLVLGLECCCLLVAVLQVRVDVLSDPIDLVLHLGKTLNPIVIKSTD